MSVDVEPAERRRPISRRGSRLFAFVGLLLLGAALWSVRWSLASSHGSGDTFWYTRQALRLGGRTEQDATASAARFVVQLGRGSDPEAWVAAARLADPRYVAIFESRPVYPLTAALFVGLAGTSAMAISSAIAAALFAAAMGLLGWLVTRSMLAAILAVAAAFALPSGGWLSFLYADGWMLALWVASLAFATLYLERGQRRWLAAFALGLGLLYATKSANGAVLVAAVVFIALVVAVHERSVRTRATGLAVAAGVIGLAQLIVFAALHLPGLSETVQDLLTVHFQRPDADAPWSRLVQRDLAMAPGLLAALVGQPIVLAIGGVGLASLVVVVGWRSALLLAAGFATVLTVAIHPVSSEIPRLMAPIWVTVAVGWAALGALLVRRTSRLVDRSQKV
jgi:hypothetical protein